MRLITLVLVLAGLAAPLWADTAGRLTVSGRGTAEAVPDMATLTLGVTHEAETADRAMDKVSADLFGVLERLRAAGIAERDLQTRGLTLSPVWTNYDAGRQREITGFAASNLLTVRVREMDRLGAVLNEVVGAGANSFRGLSFGLQDPAPAMAAARRAAVADAMAKAALYAEAAGVTLGPVLSLEEGSANTPRPLMARAMNEASDAVPVAPGEVSLSASVSMVFALGE